MTQAEIHNLKEAAGKATKGEWIIDQRGDFIGIESTGDTNEWVCYEEGKIDQQDIDDFNFIATANPSVVLSLIADLESAREVINSLAKNIADISELVGFKGEESDELVEFIRSKK